MTRVGEVEWGAARAALAESVGRVAALLRSVRDPRAPSLGGWQVAEVAAHLSHAFDVVPGLARGDRTSPLGELSDLPGLTAGQVAADPERDLGVLAERIETRAEAFLEATSSSSPDDPCPWLVAGSAVPIAVLTCHLLNEVVVHGHDIAKAARASWPIARADAALIFEGFLLPVFQVLDPRAFVIQDKAAGVQACFDVRLRGAGRFFLVFDDGALTVERPSFRRVDCHLSADPAAFLLVAWGRISQWQAISKGQLVAWGRRPWLGVQLRGLLRNP